MIEVEVTGWNAEDESLAWTGHGSTEDAAVQDAMQRGGIVEIGEVTIVRQTSTLLADAEDASSIVCCTCGSAVALPQTDHCYSCTAKVN